MTDDPVKLVTKPTAKAEIRDSIVRDLREVLAQAEAGDIDAIIVLALHPDGEWSGNNIATTRFSEVIGRIEIVKQQWIAQYLASHR
jgi:hypothetical protein